MVTTFVESERAVPGETGTVEKENSSPETTERHWKLFHERISQLFRMAIRVTLRRPSRTWFMAKSLFRQKRAARTRERFRKQGLEVPSVMIMSITERCNLKCKGCYAQSHQRKPEKEMEMDRVGDVVAEAQELGISIILIAGGEPLVRPEILRITQRFPKIIFPVFSNGLLVDQNTLSTLKQQPQVIPVISLEGHGRHTDTRRGEGVHDAVEQRLEMFKKNRIFFGVSITVTRENFVTVTGEAFTRRLMDMGCQLFFYVEYVPVKQGTQSLILTDDQRWFLQKLPERYSKEFPALFIGFPGDEEQYGGCLAAGRGFIHVSPGGDLEPCPFAPFSDVNLKDRSLKEALQSGFLKTVRENHDKLTEDKGGCALWANKEWVERLASDYK